MTSVPELHAQALIAIAAHTVEARRSGDTAKLLADVEHVLSSLIVVGAVPRLEPPPRATLVRGDGTTYP